jgi:hypothetical protein
MSAEHAQVAAGASGAAAGRRRGAPWWYALTAPGMLLTRSIVALALIVTPWLTALVYVAPVARNAAAGLLLLHVCGTRFLVRHRQRAAATLVFGGVLMADALCAGVLLGADLRLRGPATPIALVVVAMSFGVQEWSGALLCTAVTGAAAAATAWSDRIGPLIAWTQPSFSPSLSVESFFAGAPVSVAPGLPTVLSVETLFAGVPAIDRSAPLYMPALAIALFALCVGSGASLLRVRRALAAGEATALPDEPVARSA